MTFLVVDVGFVLCNVGNVARNLIYISGLMHFESFKFSRTRLIK